MKEPSITKHNSLIQAGYRLTLSEMRIILYGISMINPMSDDFPLEYQINIKSFINLFMLKKNTGIYTDIKETVMGKFWERELTFDIGNGVKERLRWLTNIKYGDKHGFIKIYINPHLKPLLHQLKGQFTSYHLEKVALFQSIYSVRIYEIAIMRLNKHAKSKCSFILEVSLLKENLDLVGKYKLCSDFNRRVLEPAKKEINKYSDIRLSYKLKKQGKAFHKIKFSVSKKAFKSVSAKVLKENILSPPILEKAKWLTECAGTDWDIQEIKKQFLEYATKKGQPKDLEKAFIGFVKKKLTMPT